MKNRIALVVGMLLMLTNVVKGQKYAQAELLDSLHALLENFEGHDTTKIWILHDIGDNTPIFRIAYWDSIAMLADQGLAKNPTGKVELSFLKVQATCYNNVGFILNRKGESEQAAEYYERSLVITEKIGDKNLIALAYNNLGALNLSLGDVPKCIDYYERSLAIFEELGNPIGMARGYNNIAKVHNDQGSDSVAVAYYKKAIRVCQENQVTDILGYTYLNLGSTYVKSSQKPDSAIFYLQNSLAIAEESGNELLKVNVQNHLAKMYRLQGDVERALGMLNEALPIWEKLGDRRGLVTCLVAAGQLELTSGNVDYAKSLAERAHALALESKFINEISLTSDLLHKIAKEEGEWQVALEMRDLYFLMRDSLENEAAIKAAAQQSVKYEYEKAQAVKDKEYEKQLAIEQAEKERSALISYFIGGGLLLVVASLIVVFNRLRVTRNQKAIIEEQKQVVEDAHDELEEKNQSIMDSITYAKRIQTAILPPTKLVKEYLHNSFIFYQPKDVVAGDFYWMEPYLTAAGTQGVLFAAADCTGHGVPGAMVSVVCNGGLNRAVREFGLTEPGKILDKTRELVIQEFEKSEDEVKDGMDIALCKLEGMTLSYAGANNPLWILRNGELLETKADKQPIGKHSVMNPFTTHVVELQAGDTIYVFSDGFADQFGGDAGKKYKSGRFKKLLAELQKHSMEKQRQLLVDEFTLWMGDLEQIDDVCVIGVQVG